MNQNIEKRSAIIVGAGIGGVATAARLARDGYRVTVVEKNEKAGGRCSIRPTKRWAAASIAWYGFAPAELYRTTMLLSCRSIRADVEENEGHFLAAVLNSEAARSRVAHLQSRGQWGARDFDKVVFELPIPAYDSSSALHQELVLAA